MATKKLRESQDATAAEQLERLKAERQTVDALRRLAEAQSALDMERRHAGAVGSERERLQAQVAELQLALQHQAIMLEAEQQMRYGYEDQLGTKLGWNPNCPSAPCDPHAHQPRGLRVIHAW